MTNSAKITWRKVKLGEVMSTARIDFEKVKTSEYKTVGRLPIFDQGSDNIAGYTDNPKAEYKGKSPAILFGDHTLKLKIAKPPFAIGADGVQILEPDESLLDRRFFYYAIKGLKVRSYGYERHMKYLRELEIACPTITDQKRIASILSAFDDKIELNNKINQNLEQMAQAIFKEWFVRFKIKNKKLKIKNGISEGWQAKKLSDLAETVSRGPSLQYISQKNVPVLNQRCIRNGEINLEAIQCAKPVPEKFYLQINDILINSMGTGTLGRVSRNLSIDYPMIVHNCITFIRTKNPALQLYLYYQIKSQERYFEQLAIGSTGQQSLPLDIIKNLKILLPPLNILEVFYKKIDPIWKLMGRNKNENQKLAALRDLLLPKLINGEVKV